MKAVTVILIVLTIANLWMASNLYLLSQPVTVPPELFESSTNYMPLVARMNHDGMVYADNGFYVVTCYPTVDDNWISALYLHAYSYGTYSCTAKCQTPENGSIQFLFAMENHHGYIDDGIIYFRTVHETYEVGTAWNGVHQSITLENQDWMVDTLFTIEWNQSNVQFYVNQVSVGNITEVVPQDDLCPIWEVGVWRGYEPVWSPRVWFRDFVAFPE